MCSCMLIFLYITKDNFLIIQVTLTFYLFNEFIIFFFLSNTFVALLSLISVLFRKLYSIITHCIKKCFLSISLGYKNILVLLFLLEDLNLVILVWIIAFCVPQKEEKEQSFSHGVQNWTAMKDAKIGDMPSSCKNGLGREWLHFHNILVEFSPVSNFLSRKRVINYCQLLLQFIIISI